VFTHNTVLSPMVLVWIFAINMAQNIYTINIVKSFVFLFFIFTLNRLVEKYKYIVYAPFTRPRTHYQWFNHHALHFNLVTIFSRDNVTKPHAPSSITITRNDVAFEDQCMLIRNKLEKLPPRMYWTNGSFFECFLFQM
jgi:hypothetical protein